MRWLIDTNVLIDCLRQRQDAIQSVIGRLDQCAVSALTVAELYHGVREGQERVELESLLESLVVVPVSEDIAQMGGLFARQYRKSHGAGLIDCMIAATAQDLELQLITLSDKHFPMLTDVEVPYAA